MTDFMIPIALTPLLEIFTHRSKVMRLKIVQGRVTELIHSKYTKNSQQDRQQNSQQKRF